MRTPSSRCHPRSGLRFEFAALTLVARQLIAYLGSVVAHTALDQLGSFEMLVSCNFSLDAVVAPPELQLAGLVSLLPLVAYVREWTLYYVVLELRFAIPVGNAGARLPHTVSLRQV